MKLKNRSKAFILLLISGLVLQGCTAQQGTKPVVNNLNTETSEPKEDNPSAEQESPALEKKEEVVQTDVKRVGEINYGFVDVPSQWVLFDDVDVTAPIIQYSDPTGIAIITLNAWNKPENDAKTAASSIFAKMEKEGAQNVEGATVQLGGSTAFQVYGVYPNEKKFLVTWIFGTDDGYLHYVSAESSEDGIVEMVNLIESSFSLEK